MECLELKVGQCGPDEQRIRIGTNEGEEVLNPARKLLRADGNEADHSGIPVAHVVLLFFELAGRLGGTSAKGQKLAVDAFDQGWAEGVGLLDLLLGGIQRTAVENGLDHLRTDFSGCLVLGVFRLILKNLIHRADGAFHARGDDRFLVPQQSQEDLAVVHNCCRSCIFASIAAGMNARAAPSAIVGAAATSRICSG